jgi:xanthine dehydrogenase accessory factor
VSGGDVEAILREPAEAQERVAREAIDIAKLSQRWLAEGRTIGLATVVDTWGSSPVPIGGQMAIADAETFQGSVSGGCVENEVIIAGTEVIAGQPSRLLEFGVSNETAWGAGLPCGGRIGVFVERLTPEQDTNFINRIVEAKASRSSLVVSRRLEDGERKLFESGDNAPAEVAERLRSGHSGIVETASGKFFLQAVVPNPRIIIIGATHIAQTLASLAPLVGIDVVVIDPREAYAASPRFYGRKVVVGWPQETLPDLGLDAYSAVVALSHVEHIDDQALILAAPSACRYVGALGSTRNHAKRRERLAAQGLTLEQIDRINSPVGLDIGARTPEEIALSILAQVVLTYRGPRRA